jgi:hypothetical protein
LYFFLITMFKTSLFIVHEKMRESRAAGLAGTKRDMALFLKKPCLLKFYIAGTILLFSYSCTSCTGFLKIPRRAMVTTEPITKAAR